MAFVRGLYEAQLGQKMLEAEQNRPGTSWTPTGGSRPAASSVSTFGNTSGMNSAWANMLESSGTLPAGGGGGTSSYIPSTRGVSYAGGGVSLPATERQSIEEQLRYDPWAAHRGAAGTELAGGIGATSPSDVYRRRLEEMATGEFRPDDPSYQWRFKQGQQAVERSAAARGLLNSGNVALELQQHGQEAASQEYGAQFGRMLQGLAGVESAYDTQQKRLMEMAGVGISPTAGGALNVSQGQLAVAQGQLGVQQQVAAQDYALGLQKLATGQAASVGGASGTMSAGYATPSWDSYFASMDALSSAQAARTAQTSPNYDLSSSGMSYL